MRSFCTAKAPHIFSAINEVVCVHLKILSLVNLGCYYRISLVITQSFHIPRSRSRSLGLFRKAKTHIIAQCHMTDFGYL